MAQPQLTLPPVLNLGFIGPTHTGVDRLESLLLAVMEPLVHWAKSADTVARLRASPAYADAPEVRIRWLCAAMPGAERAATDFVAARYPEVERILPGDVTGVADDATRAAVSRSDVVLLGTAADGDADSRMETARSFAVAIAVPTVALSMPPDEIVALAESAVAAPPADSKESICAGFWREAPRSSVLGAAGDALRNLLLAGAGRTASGDGTVAAASEASDCRTVARQVFARADGLATRYAGHYRGAFTLAYLLSAGAVFSAVAPIALGWANHDHALHRLEPLWTVIELATIVTIVALVAIGGRAEWHERWIRYRFLAELLRYQELLAPANVVTRYSVGEPVSSNRAKRTASALAGWPSWVLRRAVAVNAAAKPLVLTDARGYLRDALALVASQAQYHHRRSHVEETFEHRLHRAGMTCFVLTFVACAAHLVVHSPWLTLVTTFLPALGAALAGIVVQSEAVRLAAASEAAAHRLDEIATGLETHLDGMSEVGGSLPSEAANLIRDAAELMIGETLGWEDTVAFQPLRLPG